MEQIYYSEASENGGYDVVKRQANGDLLPIEHYRDERTAIKIAHLLNEEHEKELRDLEGRE